MGFMTHIADHLKIYLEHSMYYQMPLTHQIIDPDTLQEYLRTMSYEAQKTYFYYKFVLQYMYSYYM